MYQSTHKLYLRVLSFHSLLAIPSPAPLGEVVHCCELNEGRKDKSIADGNEPVHGCSIGHFGERVPRTDAKGGHGQHSGHPWVQTKLDMTILNLVFMSQLETNDRLASLSEGGHFNNS